MSPLLEIRGLCLGYGRADIVHGIDLTVPAGSVVSLIGANGAGKTTTLRGISGLIRPRAGVIRFDGADITGLPAHRIAAGGLRQVPEGRQIFAAMTVDENLRLGAYTLSDRRRLAQARDRVLDRFPRLRERLAQQAGLLSGGEQQMLALGRALISAPSLLLLDEPSMGLAPRMVAEIFTILAALKRDGCTLLLVEQNARAALALSDHAYVLEQGRVRLDGPGSVLAHDPAVVDAYLG
jgi:branched-chain amino acid transport system ATP-binding protein